MRPIKRKELRLLYLREVITDIYGRICFSRNLYERSTLMARLLMTTSQMVRIMSTPADKVPTKTKPVSIYRVDINAQTFSKDDVRKLIETIQDNTQ